MTAGRTVYDEAYCAPAPGIALDTSIEAIESKWANRDLNPQKARVLGLSAPSDDAPLVTEVVEVLGKTSAGLRGPEREARPEGGLDRGGYVATDALRAALRIIGTAVRDLGRGDRAGATKLLEAALAVLGDDLQAR